VTSISFAGRSKIWRISVSCAIESVLPAPQWGTSARLVQHDRVRIGDPPERIALGAGLAAARLAGQFAQARRLLPQAVARGRLRIRRTVEAKPALQIGVLRLQACILALKLGHLRLKPLDPALKPFDEAANLGRKLHSRLESQSDAALPQITLQSHFHPHRDPDSPPPWELYYFFICMEFDRKLYFAALTPEPGRTSTYSTSSTVTVRPDRR
jgi:hypothetical protein